MAARAPHGNNAPPVIIIKKVIADGHGGHHGGAWKVAYADFVTAMMAFFLLMWLLGATTEKQRKALADYFTPTLIEFKQNSAGSNGLLGGDAMNGKDNYPNRASQTGTRSMTIPAGAQGGIDVGTGAKGSLKNKEMAAADDRNFAKMKETLARKMQAGGMAKLGKHVRFVPTNDGLRIDLIDDADYSMFALGTTQFDGQAAALIKLVAESIGDTENQIMIRGHTDSLRYGDPLNMNNWMLSSARAEATRRLLSKSGIAESRFDRIEGVADREPYIEKDPADARNRRVAVTLLYRKSGGGFGSGGARPGGMASLMNSKRTMGPGGHSPSGYPRTIPTAPTTAH